MSTAALTPAFPQALDVRPLRSRWIISRGQDLTWFIGSAAIGYLALGLMSVGFPITLIYLIWLVGVDGPHVMATVTRTYFDTEERKRLGWFLWIIDSFNAGRTSHGVGRASVPFLSVRRMLAALSHCETALWIHDAVEG